MLWEERRGQPAPGFSDGIRGIMLLDLLLCCTEQESCKASFLFGGDEGWREGVRKEGRRTEEEKRRERREIKEVRVRDYEPGKQRRKEMKSRI